MQALLRLGLSLLALEALYEQAPIAEFDALDGLFQISSPPCSSHCIKPSTHSRHKPRPASLRSIALACSWVTLPWYGRSEVSDS